MLVIHFTLHKMSHNLPLVHNWNLNIKSHLMKLNIKNSNTFTLISLTRDGFTIPCFQEGDVCNSTSPLNNWSFLRNSIKSKGEWKLKLGRESIQEGKWEQNHPGLCSQPSAKLKVSQRKKASTVPESMPSHLQASCIERDSKWLSRNSCQPWGLFSRLYSSYPPSSFHSHKDVSIYQSCTPASIHWNESKGPGTESQGFVLLINTAGPIHCWLILTEI